MALSLGTIWAVPLTLAAQETPPGELTLEEALAIARNWNPGVRQAEQDLALNGVEARATWADQILPRVDLNLLRTGFAGNLTRRSTDFFGNPIENPGADWVFNSNTSQGITLNWTIQGSNLFDARARQSRTNLNRRLRLDAAAWELEAEVRSRFFDALEQRELLAVEEAIRTAREVDLESARRLFQIAQRSRVDVLTAEVQVERQELNVQEQRRRYEQALLLLGTSLGNSEMGAFHPAAPELPSFDPAGLDVDVLVERALGANPSLQESEGAVAGARLGVREARQRWFPTLNLSYNYGRLAQTRQGDALFDLSLDEREMQSSFAIILSLPMFNTYFRDEADEVRARVDLENRREALREQRLEVERQVRTELINLDNQHRSLAVAARSLELAGEAARLAREEYRLGTRTFEQLQETVTQEADARRQIIQARYGFVDALLELERVVGGRVLPPSGF
ncbi:MAG: TolC family protein [Longimicrobiales bacterium]|nr:TolC family protein [Longimicrobiales bacterium]